MSFEDTLDRHHLCEVVILPRFHRNRPRLIPGLYCLNHGCLIKWLSQQHSDELRQSGVEYVEPLARERIAAELVRKNWRPNQTPMIMPKDQDL